MRWKLCLFNLMFLIITLIIKCHGFNIQNSFVGSHMLSNMRQTHSKSSDRISRKYNSNSSNERRITTISSTSTSASRTSRRMTVAELFDDESNNSNIDNRTDEEKGLTHGYEGSFKVGDKVRVIKHMKIFSVKQYAKEGFDPHNYTGTISSIALYGRKHKTLCSAITPIIVEFQPNDQDIPEKMFEKKFQLHFDATELELVNK